MTDLPLSLHTAYQDLVEAHRMRPLEELVGTPVLKQQRQKAFWYDRQRIGDKLVDRYIGPDGPDMRDLVETKRSARETHAAFAVRCSDLVAQLAAGGLPRLDRATGKVLNALARVGVFRLGGTLVGTHAFRLYAAELGVRPEPHLGVTEDIDIAAFAKLSVAIDDRVEPSLQKTFGYLDLQPVPGLDARQKPTRWRMPGGGVSIDFLTPRMQSKRDVLPIDTLGVHATVLSYLNFLIAEPILAVALYREGVAVQVPKPERFAVHKLILSAVRPSSEIGKVRKDMAQASWLVRILVQDRPGELAKALNDARGRGSKWRSMLDKAIGRDESVGAMLAEL